MLHTVARPSTESGWQAIGQYSLPRKVRTRTTPMTNPVKRGSASSAQPQFTHQIISHDSPSNSSRGLGVNQSTYASAPYSSAAVAGECPVNNNWLPKDTSLQTGRVNTFDINLGYPAEPAWSTNGVTGPSGDQYQQTVAPRRQTRLPPESTPSIQISSNYGDTFDAHIPQASRISQAELLSSTVTPRYPNNYLTVDTSYPYDPNFTPMSNVPAPPSPSVSHHNGRHSRQVTPHLELTGRERAHSEHSHDAHTHSPSSQNPLDPISPGGYEISDGQPAPRKSRTIKRAEAPMNADHKYICDFSDECVGLVFDRKCEWGKHMDKHDRPYRCPHPACAKLQGFTYSGGLLRHEREVHGKHGGPKAFLMCPYSTCKRHTEKGFTRKENLQEHVRRVHADDPPAGEQQLMDAAPTLDQADQPTSALSTGVSADELYMAAGLNGNKRKRSFAQDDSPVVEVHELREQVKRLKSENDAKSALIHRLEEDARAQSMRLAAVEKALFQLQQGGR